MPAQPLYLRSTVPAGRSGRWVVEKVVRPPRPQPEHDPRPGCFHYRPGRYTALRRDCELFMTDLYDEWWTQQEAIQRACQDGGEVLITGLGLGLVVESMLRTPGSRVRCVTVLENSRDVIRLVEPHLQRRFGGRLMVIEADAFGWRPPFGTSYSVVWHDIWPNPHRSGVLEEVELLEDRYEPNAGWQGSWVTAYRAAESGGSA